MRTGFIGAGKVGFSLGKYLAVNGIEVSGYYSRSTSSAKAAAEFTGTRCFESLSELCSESRIIVLSVPDNELTGVYNSICANDLRGKCLCHCSGAMSADEVFHDIESLCAYGCSVHPLFPISSRYDSYKELGRAYFCLEGSSSGTQLWKDILTALGNQSRVITADAKARYHAACSVISNLVCALADQSFSLLSSCGFSKEEAAAALKPLAEHNIENIFAKDPEQALTGPVERNDTETVRRHLTCITEKSDRKLYIAASLRLTEMAQRRHKDKDYSEMNKLLHDAEET